jgi:hypothetical protein
MKNIFIFSKGLLISVLGRLELVKGGVRIVTVGYVFGRCDLTFY